MKGATVYHQIKGLRNTYSIRECARLLGISVNTVRKYASMSLEEASTYIDHQKRKSQFDVALVFILEELEDFPKINATKLLRKVKEKYPSITAKDRAFRKYLRPLRRSSQDNQKIRYFEPVLDMVAGHQVQVDMGEETVQKDRADNTLKVYFISFVFSYSRKGYVYFQLRPFNTASFIEAHKAAFEFFGGLAKEYVYDQTKLVVIEEKYREVFFNERFYQFALRYEFSPRVCEGYDPQSKGKVERFIRYVKEDFLYGDYFIDIADVQRRSLVWLVEVANCRIHAITKRRPAEMFEEERPLLNHSYKALKSPDIRWADKTGLISFEGNRYSAPHIYQRQNVGVIKKEDRLILSDLNSGEQIAFHDIPSAGKGHIIKNNNHYRNYRKSLETISDETAVLFKELPAAEVLIERIQSDNPKIMRDQLRGLSTLYKKFSAAIWQQAIPTLLKLPVLKVSLIESVLSTYQHRQHLGKIESDQANPQPDESSALDRSLDRYMEVVSNA